MLSADGKMHLTDVATTEQMFRLIQSIPSPKAEPFKLVDGPNFFKEQLDESRTRNSRFKHFMMEYKALGYSDNWINKHLKSVENTQRTNQQAETLRPGGKRPICYLTDIIYQTWADKTTQRVQTLKGLKKYPPRDN